MAMIIGVDKRLARQSKKLLLGSDIKWRIEACFITPEFESTMARGFAFLVLLVFWVSEMSSVQAQVLDKDRLLKAESFWDNRDFEW